MSATAAWDFTSAPTSRRMPCPDRPRLVSLPTGDAVREPGFRLTRVGRAVVVSVALLLLVASAFIGWSGFSTGSVVPASDVVVQPGQTLSEIAAVELPALSISEGVTRIQLANDLVSGQVTAGQVLVIPAH